VSECPFCKRVARGEYGAHSADAVTFEPLNPVTPGHLLVIPRKHIRDVGEDPWLAARVMRLAALMASRHDSANIITSLGAPATQTVFHAHLHVVPRREGDGLHLPWTGQVRS